MTVDFVFHADTEAQVDGVRELVAQLLADSCSCLLCVPTVLLDQAIDWPCLVRRGEGVPASGRVAVILGAGHGRQIFTTVAISEKCPWLVDIVIRPHVPVARIAAVLEALL